MDRLELEMVDEGHDVFAPRAGRHGVNTVAASEAAQVEADASEPGHEAGDEAVVGLRRRGCAVDHHDRRAGTVVLVPDLHAVIRLKVHSPIPPWPSGLPLLRGRGGRYPPVRGGSPGILRP